MGIIDICHSRRVNGMEDSRKKILIVEDDHNLQIVYKKKFSELGHDVSVASNGNQAMTLAKELTPDLILLDIMLPEGMNGFDVMMALDRDIKLKDVPVIVLTNLDSEKDTAMAMGAADYIIKANTSIDELVEKVKRYL